MAILLAACAGGQQDGHGRQKGGALDSAAQFCFAKHALSPAHAERKGWVISR
jgi:hypothetical protein